MINILSYLGMSLQSEVCLWTLLGLIRTIFDATLFKMNANLKQVWQMSMPMELSVPLQRGLRTMISGIMLVQCFTVYVYLASYIVLLYPVFLEERPALVLPWLLLAAIRKLLCELTSLALGLGTCVLLGPARPPCVKFVVIKVISIMPSFYMWMLLYSYYHTLKVASVFKTFSTGLPASEIDYGLELAVRRRRAKSLLGEEQLRRRLISNCYNNHTITTSDIVRPKTDYSARMTHGTDTSTEDVTADSSTLQPMSNNSHRMMLDTPVYFEDWLSHEVVIPRDTDRILEQFSTMMLQISAYISKEGVNSSDPTILSHSEFTELRQNNLNCTTMPPDSMDTPPLVGSSNARTASYLRDYPQIFMKKPEISLSLGRDSSTGRQSQINTASKEENDLKLYHKGSYSLTSNGSIIIDAEVPASTSKKTNDEEEKKKVQKKSSEKVVKFIQNKRNSSSGSENNKNESSGTKSYKLDTKDVSNSTDSIISLTDKTNSQHYFNVISLKKDEIKNKTRKDNNSQENNLQIKISSSTSLEESNVSFNTNKASSTHHIKENKNNQKKKQE